MVVRKIDPFKPIDFPGEKTLVSVDSLSASNSVHVKQLGDSRIIFHFCFSKDTKLSKDKLEDNLYNLEDVIENFPSRLCIDDGVLKSLATCTKYRAKLIDKLEHLTKLDENIVAVECILGCGTKTEFTTTKVTALFKEICKISMGYSMPNIVLETHGMDMNAVESLAIGVLAFMSKHDGFKGKKPKTLQFDRLIILHDDINDSNFFITKCKAVASAIHCTCEMVIAPPNVANTTSISLFLKDTLTSLGLQVRILEENECNELGMGCFLAVAQGSIYPPKFIHATYTPSGEIKNKIALVGKGIMFDSGGLNIKSAATQIEYMKFDMTGMATVFGAAQAIAKIKPDGVQVHFISAMCENMCGSSAYRPGDIIKASNGKTVEVINTDAEGRLTLADALVYAEKLHVDVIMDVATLTGGSIVALGYNYSAYFCNDEQLSSLMFDLFEKSGELSWRLPLANVYKDSLESKVADLSNCNYKVKCSTLNAALFLQEFVNECKWVHVDFAGPVYDFSSDCATGYGLRTMVNFVLQYSGLRSS